jgi:very-short-patch-repair endonuclease
VHDLSPVAALATSQHGVVHRDQVLALGYPKHQLARWVRAGRLIRLGADTFVFTGAPSTWEQSLAAGLLELGDGALVAGRSAAALLAFDGFPPGPVEFLVPRPRRGLAPDRQVHTSKAIGPADRTTRMGFACTSASRTIIDLAAEATAVELGRAIDSALRDRLASEAFLRRRLAALRGSGRPGVRLLDDVLLDSGGHSHLERRFLAVVRESGLRRPVCQVVHRRGSRVVARTDFCWEAERLVAEVAGHLRHASPSERQRDAERHTELQLLGYLVLTFTYDDVFGRPSWVTARLREALALRQTVHVEDPGAFRAIPRHER